jgi:hypothetical protein
MELPISRPETVVRSPFVSLSGHGDEFDTDSDLCRTVRSGVFLEEGTIPHLPICPRETGTSLHAYLYNFYMHGNVKALEEMNKIPPGEVWFLLNGKCLWHATHAANFDRLFTDLGDNRLQHHQFHPSLPETEVNMVEIMGSAEMLENQQDETCDQSGDDSAHGVEDSSTSDAKPAREQDRGGLIKVL